MESILCLQIGTLLNHDSKWQGIFPFLDITRKRWWFFQFAAYTPLYPLLHWLLFPCIFSDLPLCILFEYFSLVGNQHKTESLPWDFQEKLNWLCCPHSLPGIAAKLTSGLRWGTHPDVHIMVPFNDSLQYRPLWCSVLHQERVRNWWHCCREWGPSLMIAPPAHLGAASIDSVHV